MRNFGIILMAHGEYAVETYNSAKMICGEIEGVITLNFGINDSKDEFKERFYNSYVKLSNKYEFVLCICDIYGGTPFNVLLEYLLEGLQFTAYTGLNLPMVINFAFMEEISEKDLTESIEENYKNSLININRNLEYEMKDDLDELNL